MNALREVRVVSGRGADGLWLGLVELVDGSGRVLFMTPPSTDERAALQVARWFLAERRHVLREVPA